MNDVLIDVLKTVGTILAPILATLLTALAYKALKRAGLDLDAEKQAKLEYLARQAILRAEEWGANQLKTHLPATSGQKLQRAVTDLLDKVPGISDVEAAALVHAELPKVALGASGFLQAVRTAATTAPTR
ncbi:MAG: hypothetical protein A3H96_11275 [Acidobacteria bacterium RIFCSPLOWO2_02_FULL_67_36]|nr:MAG: hypothetical protein A3H96_11275 [Acidobacteria bacterium RIFCSPLOWO2_02_FULL_67_36]OFW23979.1 MAG: hypothetical protein A3G21_03645 [Acidobacteria bacterium RIFCSPLOWO2_12_FULL_66_21]